MKTSKTASTFISRGRVEDKIRRYLLILELTIIFMFCNTQIDRMYHTTYKSVVSNDFTEVIWSIPPKMFNLPLKWLYSLFYLLTI